MCRETVPEIIGGDWKGLSADSREVVRWHYQLVGCGWSESQSRRHVNDSGEVGLHWSTVIHCSVGEYSDFEDDALWNTSVMCSERRRPKISHAAAFWTDWRFWIKLTQCCSSQAGWGPVIGRQYQSPDAQLKQHKTCHGTLRKTSTSTT